MHTEIEMKLKARAKRTRIINSAISASLLILLVIFFIIREFTKTVTDLGFGHKSIVYNVNISLATGLIFTAFVISLLYLIFALILGKIDTVEVNGNIITLYRGIGAVELYINGKKVDRDGGVLKGKLNDGSFVLISMSRNHFFAQMEFTNGHSDIYL